MPRTVTVGMDGSAQSLAAADWAAREALFRGLPLRLVHIWDWAPLDAPSLPPEQIQRHWAHRLVHRAEVDIAGRYPGLRIAAEQVPGNPEQVLLDAAGNDELVVLGSSRLGGVAGFLAGSVSLSVVARATGPVVLVRGEEPGARGHGHAHGHGRAHPPETASENAAEAQEVVLGVDPRHPSDPLLRFGFETAASRRAPLRAVLVWTARPGHREPAAVDADRAERRARALTAGLAPWREKFPGVMVTQQVTSGHAAQLLIDASEDAGLVAVGRHPRRHALGPRIDAVTHAVIHHVACPVAVVPID